MAEGTQEVHEGPAEKEPGRLIYVYRNGDKFKNYKRYVVNRKTVRSLDYLFNELTKLLQPSFGAVRSIRTPTHGHAIDSLEELQGGKSYVATGHGRFVRLPYEKARSLAEFNVPGRIKRSAEPYGAPKPVLIKPVKHSRIIASGKVKKDPGDSFFIHVFVNGDDHNPATRVRLKAAERSTMVAALNAVNKKVQTTTGAVLRLYSLTGERIRAVEELQNGGSFVAVGREKQFRQIQYGKHELPVWHAGTQIPQAPLSPGSTMNLDKLYEGGWSTNDATRQQHISHRPPEAGSRHSNPHHTTSRPSNQGSTLSLHERDHGPKPVPPPRDHAAADKDAKPKRPSDFKDDNRNAAPKGQQKKEKVEDTPQGNTYITQQEPTKKPDDRKAAPDNKNASKKPGSPDENKKLAPPEQPLDDGKHGKQSRSSLQPDADNKAAHRPSIVTSKRSSSPPPPKEDSKLAQQQQQKKREDSNPPTIDIHDDDAPSKSRREPTHEADHDAHHPPTDASSTKTHAEPRHRRESVSHFEPPKLAAAVSHERRSSENPIGEGAPDKSQSEENHNN